jgi:hypothetical protein
MKARLTILLIGALAALTPTLSAQRGSYGTSASVSGAYYRGGYETSRVWIPGYYETVARSVYVPGPVKSVWVPAAFEWRIGHCGWQYVCVRQGHWETVQLPGHYEIRHERVYQPGRWVARGSCS